MCILALIVPLRHRFGRPVGHDAVMARARARAKQPVDVVAGAELHRGLAPAALRAKLPPRWRRREEGEEEDPQRHRQGGGRRGGVLLAGEVRPSARQRCRADDARWEWGRARGQLCRGRIQRGGGCETHTHTDVRGIGQFGRTELGEHREPDLGTTSVASRAPAGGESGSRSLGAPHVRPRAPNSACACSSLSESGGRRWALGCRGVALRPRVPRNGVPKRPRAALADTHLAAVDAGPSEDVRSALLLRCRGTRTHARRNSGSRFPA